MFPPDPLPVLDVKSLTRAGGGLLPHMVGRAWHRGLASKQASLEDGGPLHHLVDGHIVGEGVQGDLHVVLHQVVFTEGELDLRKRIYPRDMTGHIHMGLWDCPLDELHLVHWGVDQHHGLGLCLGGKGGHLAPVDTRHEDIGRGQHHCPVFSGPDIEENCFQIPN